MLKHPEADSLYSTRSIDPLIEVCLSSRLPESTQVETMGRMASQSFSLSTDGHYPLPIFDQEADRK